MPTRSTFVAVLSLFAGSACASQDPVEGVPGDGPGSQPWTTDEIGCAVDSDCGPGETCTVAGVCAMSRCAEEYESRAPLGSYRYFQLDREIVVVSDASYVDGFEGGAGYLGTWELAAPITDVAGGNLTGTRPHALVVSMAGSSVLRIQSAEGENELEIGFVPRAIAAADIDSDGVDELLAAAGDTVALCNVVESTCSTATIDGADLTDVAFADVDGDGFAEPILLDPGDGASEILVWNTNSDVTGEEPLLAWELNKATFAIGAADIDGDSVAEILMLEDGGWWGWSSDALHALSAKSGQIVVSSSVDGGSLDVAGEGSEVLVLRDDRRIDHLRFDGSELSLDSYDEVSVGESSTKLAVLDWDGDSPAGRLTGGPELVTGEAVPLAVLVVPPTERAISNGWGRVSLGNVESQSVSDSEILTLNVGLVVSYGADLGPIFEGEVSAFIERETTVTHTLTSGFSVGQTYSLQGDASMAGGPQAGVVLSCGCFHHYRYETEDPANKMGGSGHPVDVLVPVGGQTGLWSLTRYNAMAEKLGNLPVIPLGSRVGELASYATEPTTLDGALIPQEDLLFPEPPSFVVSDVGNVGWALTIRESETNATASSTKIGIGGSLGAFGAEVDVKVSEKFAIAYAITVGTDTSFAGEIPPIIDNPETPEDEYTEYRYSMAPMVYRQHYENAAGEDAAFYVLDYAVAR